MTKIEFDKDLEEQRINNLPYKLNHNIKDLLDFYKFAIIRKNTSAVILIDGRSGYGKTTLANQIACYCDINGYDLRKIHFNPETFLNGGVDKIGLSNSQPGDVIVFDEAMLISNRSAMSQINRMVIQAMSMMRSKRIIVIFNVNSIFDLDRNLVLSRADCLFHVYGENLIDRGNVMAFFKGLDGRDRLKELYLRGKKYYDYSQPKSNFFCNFAMNFVLDDREYEYNKQKGVNEFLNKPQKEKSQKTIKSRDLAIKWIKDNHPNMSLSDIGEITCLGTTTVHDILVKFNKVTPI